MTLAVLRRVAELAGQGTVLVGRKPMESPSLNDDPAAFAALAGNLFGAAPHAFGKGFFYPSFAEAFAALRLAPDFSAAAPDARLLFAHRRLDDGDIYFVSNRHDLPVQVSAIFRVTGIPA